MNTTALKSAVLEGAFDATFAILYGESNLEKARKRYADAVDGFEAIYGISEDARLFSVPGRTEICGNHTDHNHGKCVAGSADCDIIAVACVTRENTLRLRSEGFPGDMVELSRLEPDSYPRYKSVALCAGMCRAFLDHGHRIGGFNAYTTSNVLKGSGLSSSAAFEVMVGNLLNHLFNDGNVSAPDIAKYAQWSENVFFGKPCGLLDQTACAVGGIISLDFENPTDPIIEKMDFDLTKYGYELCITDTGGSHSDLNDEYAAIPGEMKAVAALLSKTVLRQVKKEAVLDQAITIREQCGDRALLRALHYLDENSRVDAIVEAMKKGDIEGFLSVITASGHSSACYLQNVFASKSPAEQGISLALYTAEQALRDCPAPSACRVHGGGFAGTMQAFVPSDYAPIYKEKMDRIFGEGACHIMRIRPLGAIELLPGA